MGHFLVAFGVFLLWQLTQVLATPNRLNATRSQHPVGAIPHILHHVYLSGLPAYFESGAAGQLNTSFRQSCLEFHPNWQHRFWDQSAADALVQEFFPDFLDVWNSYDTVVLRGDALRYMLLYTYGGLYLDLDVQCLQPADSSLEASDIVLQGTGPEGVTNAVLASRPHEAFWLEVLDICRERSPLVTGQVHSDPLMATGPSTVSKAVRDALKHDVSHTFVGGGWGGARLQVEQQRVRIYGLGDWYGPCWVSQGVCFRRLKKALLEGRLDLEDLVGIHWFSGSWRG